MRPISPLENVAGNILNDFLSMSPFAFVLKYQALSKKYKNYSNVSNAQSHEFVLQKDIWGPKESLLFVIEDDCYVIKYAARNDYTYNQMKSFLTSSKDFNLAEETYNTCTFELNIASCFEALMIILANPIPQYFEINAIVTKNK